mmetsp:Transcript_8721/g.13026  ORF Transcript_8721/g.13026 Transcript_8721/m.13026 type:complete len:363 (+) Transcript_8721:1061-2149(+)
MLQLCLRYRCIVQDHILSFRSMDFLVFFCGLASVTFTRSSRTLSNVADSVESRGVPRILLASFAALVLGVVALRYPEVTYQGFLNFDRILEGRAYPRMDMPLEGVPYTWGWLLQIAIAKLSVTVLAKSFRLKGGIYAPSLFIGAALGLSFGEFIRPFLEGFIPANDVLSIPQTYALAGMAATLAGTVRIPLTATLLLFEITRDYSVILPVLIAVAVSYSQVSSAEKSPWESPIGGVLTTPKSTGLVSCDGSDDLDIPINERNSEIHLKESRDWEALWEAWRDPNRDVAILIDSRQSPGCVSEILERVDAETLEAIRLVSSNTNNTKGLATKIEYPGLTRAAGVRILECEQGEQGKTVGSNDV